METPGTCSLGLPFQIFLTDNFQSERNGCESIRRPL